MNIHPQKRIAITVSVSVVVTLLYFLFIEWQQNESYMDSYLTPAHLSGNTPGGLPIAPLTLWDKVEMLLDTDEAQNNTKAKKSVEKRDNES